MNRLIVIAAFLLFSTNLFSQCVFKANQVNWGGNLAEDDVDIYVLDNEIAIADDPTIYILDIIKEEVVSSSEFYTTIKYQTTAGTVLIEYNPVGIEKVDAVFGETVINYRQVYYGNNEYNSSNTGY